MRQLFNQRQLLELCHADNAQQRQQRGIDNTGTGKRRQRCQRIIKVRQQAMQSLCRRSHNERGQNDFTNAQPMKFYFKILQRQNIQRRRHAKVDIRCPRRSGNAIFRIRQLADSD